MAAIQALTTLEVGRIAPNFNLESHRGGKVSLSSFYGNKNVILFFVRAYTCYSCREHVRELARLYAEFKQHNTEVLVIVHADRQVAIGYADITGAPFPILSDPGHSVYEQYGLQKLLLLSTRSGSVIVDKNGSISYLRSMTNPWAWRTETRNLIEHIKGLP